MFRAEAGLQCENETRAVHIACATVMFCNFFNFHPQKKSGINVAEEVVVGAARITKKESIAININNNNNEEVASAAVSRDDVVKPQINASFPR